MWVLKFSLLALVYSQTYRVPAGYDKYMRPSVAVTGDAFAPPENIELSVEINEVYSVSSQGVIQFRIRIIESWNDDRLTPIDLGTLGRIAIDEKTIWKPDGYF